LIADRRIFVCVALSVAAHVALAHGLSGLPKRAESPRKRLVSIRVVSPPPAPEPPAEQVVAQPVPTPRAAPRAQARPHAAPQVPPDVVPKDVPPPEHAAASSGTAAGPVFGISMESTSQAGGGPSMPVGSPTRPTAEPGGAGHGTNKEASEPVAAYEVTTMPLPQGRCQGAYTEQAKQAAIEGTVVLDLVVGADGRVREVRVVRGLGYGLDEAAIAALEACHFSPGEKSGARVPVRIRGFKIRFLLQNDE
jgi:protein TonB